MKYCWIFIVSLCCLVSCKKRDLPATTTDQSQQPDEQPVTEHFKVSGVGDTLTIKMVDEITIPITITSNSGQAEQVTLSISSLPMRMTAEIGNSSGITPFSTTLRVRTHLVAHHSKAAIKITVVSTGGRKKVHSIYPAIDFKGQDAIKLFYDYYTHKAVEKVTYIVNNDWETLKNPRRADRSPDFSYDPMTGQLRLTNLLIGGYILVEDPKYPDNYLVSTGVDASKGLIHFEQKSLWVYNASTQDTLVQPIEVGPLNFYCGLEHGNSGYQMIYKINGVPFWIEGVIPY